MDGFAVLDACRSSLQEKRWLDRRACPAVVVPFSGEPFRGCLMRRLCSVCAPRSPSQSTARQNRRHPLAALVLCGASRVSDLMIAGVWRVRGGELQGVDIDALMHEHRRIAGSLTGE